jgi:hypothetical protein
MEVQRARRVKRGPDPGEERELGFRPHERKPARYREHPVSGDPLWRWDAFHPDYEAVKPRAQIAAEVAGFIRGTPTSSSTPTTAHTTT